MSHLHEIAKAVEDLAWIYNKDGTRKPELSGFPDNVDWDKTENWPMKKELRRLLNIEKNDISPNLTEQEKKEHEKKEKEKEKVSSHIRGVVASINEMILNKFILTPSGKSSVHKDHDDTVSEELRKVLKFCLKLQDRENKNSVIDNENNLCFAQNFLRVAALYHDIGKIIGSDRHVSRGVHLMRDVSNKDRTSFEEWLMEGHFVDKHNFWTLLSHHDIFGCLCTGEASLPALSQMVSWSGNHSLKPYKSPAALVSYLMLLNAADGDSSLRFKSNLNGLRTVEAKRYIADWNTVKNLLWDKDNYRSTEVSREEFKESLLKTAGNPEETIERITRLITSSFRMLVSSDLLHNESEVRKLVEDELDMLHGARLQMFCFLFARFCKIDYGLRFINVIMLHELLDNGLFKREDKNPVYEFPMDFIQVVNINDPKYEECRSATLREMTRRVCSVLKRIVDDYGDSVAGDARKAPLMCVVMANLMPEEKSKTAWAICRALKEHESRALAWISEEVAVSPYGG
jgi:hypothetical protein